MWMSVDRMEGSLVVLIADNEQVYHMDTVTYQRLTGISPQETHMLWCEVSKNAVISARYDPEETERRRIAAKVRLERLINKKRS